MLSESSYTLGIYVYVGSACAILLCLGWWLGRRWPATWVALVVLLAAALLLTPAYPTASATTMAPALIVAAFQLLTVGYAGAEHALRPLGAVSLSALGLWLLLYLALWLRRRRNTGVSPASADT